MSDSAQRDKERDVKIGLANNAFGTTAGAVATAQAVNVARKMKKPDPNTRLGRFVLRRPKIARARWALPAIGAVNVGAQALNAGLDAQSAHYFGRELKDMKPREKVTKADTLDGYERAERLDGHGTNLAKAISYDMSSSPVAPAPTRSAGSRRASHPKPSASQVATPLLASAAVGAGAYAGRQMRQVDSGMQRLMQQPMYGVLRDKDGAVVINRRTKKPQRGVIQPQYANAQRPSQSIRNNTARLLGNPVKEGTLANAAAQQARTTAAGRAVADEVVPQISRARGRAGRAGLAAVGLTGLAAASHQLSSKQRNR